MNDLRVCRNTRWRLSCGRAITGAMALLLAGDMASAQRYEVTVYPLPDTAAREFTSATSEAINNRGEISGYARNLINNDERAVLWRADGRMIFLPALPGNEPHPDTHAFDINDNGVIVGESDSPQYSQQAVMWTDPQTILPIIDRQSNAFGINNETAVIGWVAVEFLNTEPFIWENGEWFSLHPPMKFGSDINNKKQVVGRTSNATSYVWDNGEFTALPPLLPGANAVVGSINDQGIASGWSKKDDEVWYPVIWIDGKVREMPALVPRQDASVVKINNEGVGYGTCLVSFDDFRKTIWRNNLVTEINDLLLPLDPKEPDWVIGGGGDINDIGQITMAAQERGQPGGNVARLDPVDSGLTLWGMEPSRPGQHNTIEIHHVTPGGRVTLIWGTQRGEPTPLPQCDDAIIDVQDARIAGTATADSDGVALINVNVPQNVDGLFMLQAIDHIACEVSPPSMCLFRSE